MIETMNQVKSFREKFRLVNTLKKEKQTASKKFFKKEIRKLGRKDLMFTE